MFALELIVNALKYFAI